MNKRSLSLLLILAGAAFAGTPDARLAAGPMLGHVDIVEAHIWLQTRQDADVHLTYHRQDSTDVAQTAVVRTTEAEHYIARFNLSGLEENTTYLYQVWLDGVVQSFPYPTRFTTRKFWEYRTDPPDVVLAVGSCLYVNDPPYDRPGPPYGQDFDVTAQIVAQAPDAMFWLGDNVYLRPSDFYTPTRLAYRYAHTRALPQLQPLLAATAHYATWDDHDFGPNDSNRAYTMKHHTFALFKQYWDNPSYGMPDVPGVFGLVQLSDVDVFMLDNRTYRAPRELKDPDKPHFGQAQLQWLKDSLASSHATFKLVMAGSQMLNAYTPHEGMIEYPTERAALLAFLAEQDVPGVVLVSGDRHFSELLKLEREGTYPLYELTASPLSAGLAWPRDAEADNPMRVAGTLVKDRQNFGLIQVSGPPKGRVLTLKIIDSTGKERWRQDLPAASLGVSAK